MNQSVYSLWIGRESCYNVLKKRPVWMIQMELKQLLRTGRKVKDSKNIRAKRPGCFLLLEF